MKLRIRAIGSILLLGMLLCLARPCAAQQPLPQARDISRSLNSHSSGIRQAGRLFDGARTDFAQIRQGAKLTLSAQEGIGSLYILFGRTCGAYTVKDEATGQSRVFGRNGFLHEFLDLEEAFGEAPETVSIHFDAGEGYIAEIFAFTSGKTPEHVQKWELPANGETDLVLFSTHGDDEQLFFAGLLPYYAVERGYQVQVVYFTDHRNVTLRRVGEMLDGLWAVGVRAYPVFGSFGDYHSESLEEARKIYRQKQVREEDQLAFVVENLRRFRPKVAVGHDLGGEYGHGMHMLYARLLCQAVDIAMEPDQFPESAKKYGVWDVPKTYLHLYPENQICMDWDQPMEAFEGMTPFQVTKHRGFPCHVSQQTYYSWYMQGTEQASGVRDYSPCLYGLYRTTVGADRQKNDLFENLSSYAQDIRLEQEFLAQEEEQTLTLPATLPSEPQTGATKPPVPPVSGTGAGEEPDDHILWLAAGAAAGILLVCGAVTKLMYPEQEKKKEKK